MRIILASKSPRRAEILGMIGAKFEIYPADIDESVDSSLSPAKAVEEIALRKCRFILDAFENEDVFVIAADTVVSVNDEILGKPKDKDDARRMLDLLSGKHHEVYSGFALGTKEKVVSGFECTSVKFKTLSDMEKDSYIASGEPMDKAGAYGIQQRACIFVEGISGDYFNVMGFPVCKINALSEKEFGIRLANLKLVKE